MLKKTNILLFVGLLITSVYYSAQLGSGSEFATALIRMGKQIIIFFYAISIFFVGLFINSRIQKWSNKNENFRYSTILSSVILIIINLILCLKLISPRRFVQENIVSNADIERLYTKEKIKDNLFKKLNLIQEEDFIYNCAYDSLNNWSEKLNWNIRGQIILDSTIFLNTESNKCTLFYYSLCNKNCLNEYLYTLNGAKINGKWYFFKGASLPQKKRIFGEIPSLSPTQFHILILLILDNYLLQNQETGEWEINERFFNQMINKNNPDAIGAGPKGGYGSCFHCKTFEEYVLYLSAENWKNRDTTKEATAVTSN